MNTDRELLEQAAKAAGIALISWTNMYDACDEIGGRFITQPRGEPWNPLEDDGDALRLAVKLYIGVRSHGPDHWQQPNMAVALWDFDDKAGRVTVEHSDDPQRATRRAIVRAAAEIGKAMP